MADAVLVDDDPSQLRGLAALVEQEGFRTRTAASIAEARALLAERTPDVVLADLVLPDGRGLDLLDAIAHAHLELVAAVPDTLIARKMGRAAAEAVSARAQQVLARGGWHSRAGRAAAGGLDRWLRRDGNRLNPGTSADLMAASLFVWLLETGPGAAGP